MNCQAFFFLDPKFGLGNHRLDSLRINGTCRNLSNKMNGINSGLFIESGEANVPVWKILNIESN